MAARQGLSAQISQASEDAKRAVLQRAPLKSSWFSNLNTTCTIKSAPPRTPEVLNLLGTKCGWLIKRNEQHVWQARWCCVVPHTFLYYFDADIGVGDGAPSAPPSHVQDALNQAVRDGFRGGNTAPRSSLYNVFPTSTTPSNETHAAPDVVSDEKFNTLQPAGIIDLECYSAVHRSSCNEKVLELAGDDSVNPDLRSFYFCASSETESEEWTQALLSMRHAALVDEREAFREVCDGFALQLQQLHTDMEDSKLKKEEAIEECYRVRSASEEQRRNCIRIIQEALERPLANDAARYRSELETVQQQHMGVLPAVKILSDYTMDLERNCADLKKENEQLKDQLRRTSDDDQQEAQELRLQLQQYQEHSENEKRQLQLQISTLQQKLQQSQKQVKVAQHEATTQRGDLKTQIQTLSQHKKILKKEVVDLRQKLKDLAGELSTLKHYTKSARMDLKQERQKSELLQRYVDKMESQVRVQQNMMELMSSSVAGSVRGDDTSFYATSPGGTSPRGNVFVVDDVNDKTPPSRRRNSSQKVREETANPESPRRKQHSMEHKELMRQAQEIVNMDDDKSHVSELTEDRTQRQFDAVYRSAAFTEAEQLPSLLGKSEVPIQSPSNGAIGPPSFIGVANDDNEIEEESLQQHRPKLDTINNLSSASLGGLPSRSNNPRQNHTRSSSNSSSAWTIDSNGSLVSTNRLSVAQRARLEADRKTTPVKVRVNGKGSPKGSQSPSTSSQGSFFTKLENRIVAAIDNSVLGVPDDSLENALESQESSSSASSASQERLTSAETETSLHTRENKRQQENVRSPTRSERLKKLVGGKALSPRKQESAPSVSSPSPPLTLEQRQAMQRAKQIAFLKQQGLLKDEGSLRGGAGASRSEAGGSTASMDTSSSFNILGVSRN